MESVQTLAQRKRARVEEIRAGVASLREALAAYGRAHGGRFLIYGSAVSGRLHYDSDVDLLVDFPEPQTADAVDFVELACARLKLRVMCSRRPGARRRSSRGSCRRRRWFHERRPLV